MNLQEQTNRIKQMMGIINESTDKIQKALTEFTQSYFQNTANVKINYRWSGVMGFSEDNLSQNVKVS